MTEEALLKQGLAALPAAFPADLHEKIVRYLALLAKWNRVHNLTAVRDARAQVQLHVLDCLSVIPLIDHEKLSIADVGTGAGLPGLLWALARPDWQIFLLESNGKKSAFLRETARVLAVHNVEICAHRVEAWQAPCALDWVVSRALAEIDEFLCLTAHLGSANTRWGMMKAHDDERCTVAGFVKNRVQTVAVPTLDAPRLWIELLREHKND